MQRDCWSGQHRIDLRHRAIHQPACGAVDRECGAAGLSTSAQASQAGVGDGEGEIRAAGSTSVGVLIDVQISHADRCIADQALQGCGNAMAQARHAASGWNTAEHRWIIHRRHVDRGASEALAATASTHGKAQCMAAIGIAGGREVQNSTGSQIVVEITNRALEAELSTVTAGDGDARAVAGAEAATGRGVLCD